MKKQVPVRVQLIALGCALILAAAVLATGFTRNAAAAVSRIA